MTSKNSIQITLEKIGLRSMERSTWGKEILGRTASGLLRTGFSSGWYFSNKGNTFPRQLK